MAALIFIGSLLALAAALGVLWLYLDNKEHEAMMKEWRKSRK